MPEACSRQIERAMPATLGSVGATLRNHRPAAACQKRMAQVVLSVADWEGFPEVFVCSVVNNAGQWRQEKPCEFSWAG